MASRKHNADLWIDCDPPAASFALILVWAATDTEQPPRFFWRRYSAFLFKPSNHRN